MVDQAVVHGRKSFRIEGRLDRLGELEYRHCGSLDRMVLVWPKWLV